MIRPPHGGLPLLLEAAVRESAQQAQPGERQRTWLWNGGRAEHGIDFVDVDLLARRSGRINSGRSDYASFRRRIQNIPSATGASRAKLLGSGTLVPPNETSSTANASPPELLGPICIDTMSGSESSKPT